MKVLVGCETSGVVREAFRAKGHEAWSCDLLPSQDNSPYHLQMDVFLAAASSHWDLFIFHPDCTYLTNSAAWAYGPGPYHQKVKPETLVGERRIAARKQAVDFAVYGMNLGIERIAMENPIGALSTMYRKPDQIIQPYQLGEDASKATCLWLKGLPKLRILPKEQWHPGRMVNGVRRWSNQTDSGQNRLPQTEDRWQLRSNTYPLIARAMAEQWSTL